ncbi:related to allantoate permease [Armillaria ostoyae]|uniref:Related to allantoate permease n=1 Tax=Armillaria ostoyae TaxID=47428 RepID=A0A284QKL5_ARMOS|nr:related to allantoate permease [Armillaria ostoyae]
MSDFKPTAEISERHVEERRPKFFGRLLKAEPERALLDGLAHMNETVLDPVVVKRIERRVDLLVIPALAVCYMFYYIDKTTLSYAAIFGIKEDLALGKMEYVRVSISYRLTRLMQKAPTAMVIEYLLLCVRTFSIFVRTPIGFPVGWLFWAFPTNLLMQKFPIAKYLAVNIFFWGVLLMAQAAAKDFKDMMILRILSGAAESTADPAFVLITGLWYTRSQQPIRIGLWYSANGIGIALGGLLGYAIGHIKGALPSWRYEFLIIGALCSFWALVMFTFVPDSPYYTSYWFKDEERLIVLSRKRHDQAGADTHRVKPGQIVEAFCDPKIYLFFLLGFSSNIPNGGISNFGTFIIQGFGFDTLETALMQIPYGFFICFCILFSVWVNNKAPKNSRTLLMIVFLLPNIIGSCMMAWGPETSKPTRLIGYWLTGSYNATFVLGLSLVSGNVGGQTKRAVANAAVFLGLCTGNIVGPFLFKTSEAPKYTTGIVGMLVANIVEVFVILALRILFLTSNKRRDRKMTEEGVKYDERPAMMDDITDFENPVFRYVAVGSFLF